MNSALVMVLAMFLWPFSSSKTYEMKASNSVPAASGTVKVQTSGDNGNTRLDVKVKNLANPSSLTPPAALYIVWIRPNAGTAAKAGAIGVNKKLDGELDTVTTSKNFDVFITAEQASSVTEPSGDQVLEAHVNVGGNRD